jgi:phospholipid/cholesterol/gamma-HCH transport system substrate-binding protein
MGRNAIETVLGAVVLVVAGFFMVFAYSSADLRKVQGYSVTANFPMVDGLKEGGDVKINGVKVGSIASMSLITQPGPSQYLVEMKMTLLPEVLLPVDTIAMVASESLLGGKYLSLESGVEEDMIKTDGTGRLTRTQAPMRLDDLIGQLIYSKKAEGEGTSTSSGTTADPVPPAAAVEPSVPEVSVAPAAPAIPSVMGNNPATIPQPAHP